MKLAYALSGIGLAATAALSLATVPAQAATLLSASQLGLDGYDPINKPVGDGRTAASLGALPYKTQAFTPGQNFKVTFSVSDPSGLGTRSGGKSNFGLLVNGNFASLFDENNKYNSGSTAGNDWLGTCDTPKKGKATVQPCEVTYTFKKGVTYQLALQTLQIPGGAPTGAQKITTYGLGASESYTFDSASDEKYPTPGGKVTVAGKGLLFIGMEDGYYAKPKTKSVFYDYQDYVVSAKAVPEPTTLAGLALAGGALVVSRRRKANIA